MPVTVASGSRLFGYEFPANSVPAWFTGQTDKTWVEPFGSSVNTLDDLKPSPLPPGVSGHAGLVTGWSGAVVGAEGVYVFGGGHDDYGGNEMYLINPAESEVQRLSEPSADTVGTDTTYGDGQVRPPHTYKHLSNTATHIYLTALAGPYPSGDTYLEVWKWSKASTTWSFVDDLPTSPAPLGSMESGSFYDATTGLIYVLTSYGEVWTIDPSDDSMTFVYHQNTPGFAFVEGAASGSGYALIPGLALVYRAATGEVSLIDIASPEDGWTEITVSGMFGLAQPYPCLVWHPASEKLIGPNPTTRANLFTLAPPGAVTNFASLLGTWTAATVTPDASNAVTPSAPDSNSTNGRFNLIEDFCGTGRDMLFNVNSTTDPVRFYKLPAAGI